MKTPYEQLVVGYNPNSSDARAMQRLVFDRLDDARIRYELMPTASSQAEEFAEVIDDTLHEGDRLLILGGDGTYNLVINALRDISEIERSGVELGFMAFGNRCDGAALSGRAKRDAVAMASDHVQPVTFWPLRYRVETEEGHDDIDELALGYVTIGHVLAEGARHFNAPMTRKAIEHSPSKLLSSARVAAGYFIGNYQHFTPLPEGTIVNGEQLDPRVSDLVALNGMTMATFMRNSKNSYASTNFEYTAVDVTHVRGLLSQTRQALKNRGYLPTVTVDQLVVTLDAAGADSITLQSDGEAKVLTAVSSIVIDKATEPLNVLTSLY